MPKDPSILQPALLQELSHNPQKPEPLYLQDLLQKALSLTGLDLQEMAALSTLDETTPDLLATLFTTATKVKEQIYGKRLVIFSPLYIANLCANECLYCAFRVQNKTLTRRALLQTEIANETRALLAEGHKRLLLVAGEAYPQAGFKYILESIETIYAVRHQGEQIRRLNVNIAPLTVELFKELQQAHIGTYQLFQETYHQPTYAKVHLQGPKQDFDWRLTAIDRAFSAGIEDVGLGVLFGLYDWRYELLALKQHITYLEQNFGLGPHTLSIPRLEPAANAPLAETPPYPVNDLDFQKIIAILRLAVPYTGLILSTRETAEMRNRAFALGISQISAGSRTDPGGYSLETESSTVLEQTQRASGPAAQFSLGDTRSLEEVIQDITKMGFIPSFCTACYRRGRTGKDFMELAKPGLIKNYCEPNALASFSEYLLDHATPLTRELGTALIAKNLAEREVRSDQELDQGVAQPTSLKPDSLRQTLISLARGERDLET